MYCAMTGDQETANLLLDNKVEINESSTLGDSALTIAQRKGHMEFALLLSGRGAALRSKRSLPSLQMNKTTPLYNTNPGHI